MHFVQSKKINNRKDNFFFKKQLDLISHQCEPNQEDQIDREEENLEKEEQRTPIKHCC